MAERLTDTELDDMVDIIESDDFVEDDLINLTMLASKAVGEIRERRAADLSDEEREAIVDAFDFAFKHTDETPAARSALDKVLGGGK